MADESTEARIARPLWLSIAKWAGIAIAGLVLLVALIVLGLNTSAGRRFLVDRVAGFETEAGMKIGIARIEGSIYGRMKIEGLELRDTRGVFLRAADLTLDWRPLAYLTGSKVDVRELASPEIRLLRMPEFRPTLSDPNAPLLPDIDVAIGRVAIDRFIIDPPVTGRRHIVRIAGSADIAEGRARVNLDARALVARDAAGGDVLRVKLDAVPASNRLLIDLNLAAPKGGLIDSYAGLGKRLSVAVTGQGDWAKWTGRATAQAGGASLADLAITPTSVEAIVPSYLWRYRAKGEYANDARTGMTA